ncbi:MAG TPA: hypothetical protein VFA60_07010 [Terriglobales bacterium]|nr:hypothetical protein [Terriglobales bacterium]
MLSANPLYVTLSGFPVRIALEWPFHPSTSGADWFSLHGRLTLDDGSGLHADVAVNLTQIIKEALPSLAPEHALSAVVNALRKELDTKQLELLKSGKRQPVPVSSRHYDFRNKKLIFAQASPDDIYAFLRRKTYWTAMRDNAPAILLDPIDLEYLNASRDQFQQAARRLADEGLVTLSGGDRAAAMPSLLEMKAEIEGEKDAALKALEAKHAYERA